MAAFQAEAYTKNPTQEIIYVWTAIGQAYEQYCAYYRTFGGYITMFEQSFGCNQIELIASKG